MLSRGGDGTTQDFLNDHTREREQMHVKCSMKLAAIE